MARKRMVDPEFWLDEEITSLGFEYRLFFIGTWNFADDYGVIEQSSKKLKAQIFPYDDVDCDKILNKLINLKKLIPFEKEGRKWLYIRKFLKYQRVDKPSKNRNPEAPKDTVDEDYPSGEEPLHDEVKLSKEKLREVKRSKDIYGEFKNVLLTGEEFKKLEEKLGDKGLKVLIGDLDRYIESIGKDKYKSHYATLQTWANRRVNEHVNKQLQNKKIRTLV